MLTYTDSSSYRPRNDKNSMNFELCPIHSTFALFCQEFCISLVKKSKNITFSLTSPQS